MKSGTQGHVKTKKLKMRLKLPLWQIVGILECLWQFASDCADDGAIGRYSNEDIAAYMEWEGDPDELIAALVYCRWIDEDDTFRLVIHDWDEHCPNYVRDRVKKRQERLATKKSGTVPGQSQDSPEPKATTPGQSQSTQPIKPIPTNQSIDGEAIDELKPAVDELFRKTGYRGNQGTVFWKAAYLVKSGLIPFDIVEAVARRTKDNATGNPPAFFRKSLVNACRDKDINAEDMLGSVSIPKRQHRGPPKESSGGSIKVLNDIAALSRKDST